MDRDIEQAADHAGEIWVDVPDDFPGYNPRPAGRGDTTRPDPAVIDEVKEAILDAWGVRRVSARLGQNAHVAAEAAAAVIVPATREHIAAEITAEIKATMPGDPNDYLVPGIRYALGVIDRCAAALSAGATGGRRR